MVLGDHGSSEKSEQGPEQQLRLLPAAAEQQLWSAAQLLLVAVASGEATRDSPLVVEKGWLGRADEGEQWLQLAEPAE